MVRSTASTATTVPVGVMVLASASTVTVRDTDGRVIFGPQPVPIDRTMEYIVAQCPPRVDEKVPQLKYGETVLSSSATLREVFDGGSLDFTAVVLDKPETAVTTESKPEVSESIATAEVSEPKTEAAIATETKQGESALPKKRPASAMVTTVAAGGKKLDSATTVTVRDTDGRILFGPQPVPIDRTMEYIVAQCPPRADEKVHQLKYGETVLSSSATLREVFDGGSLDFTAVVLDTTESAMPSGSTHKE